MATEPSGTRVTFDFNFALALLKNSSAKIVRSMKDAFKSMQTAQVQGPCNSHIPFIKALATPKSHFLGGVSLDSGSDWPVRP